MTDLNCPYCGAPNEVCHDDGQGYEEDVPHEMECGDCGKSFVFFTSISFYYKPRKANCLNGAPHTLKAATAFPIEYSRMRCVDCGFERKMTDEEIATLREEPR